MTTAYDAFKPEFDRLSETEKLDLSMAGLIAYQSNSNEFKDPSYSSGFVGRSYDNSMGGFDLNGAPLDTRIMDFDDQSSISLVDRMRSESYDVRITNALSDIVDPLSYVMEDSRIRQQMFEAKMDNDHFLYYRAIINAINNLKEANAENMIDAAVFQYKNFMRHPIWNTFSLIGRSVVLPIYDMAKGVLFGFKKRESDTDRIVNAIHQQTEFHRTGKIEAGGNMFTRLFRTGVVNSLSRSLVDLSSFGKVSIDSAQNAQQKKAEGQALGFYDKLALRAFGKYTDKFDTRQDGTSSLIDVNMKIHEVLMDKFNDAIYQLISIHNVQNHTFNMMLSKFNRLIRFQETELKTFNEMHLVFNAIRAGAIGENVNGALDQQGNVVDPTYDMFSNLISSIKMKNAEMAIGESPLSSVGSTMGSRRSDDIPHGTMDYDNGFSPLAVGTKPDEKGQMSLTLPPEKEMEEEEKHEETVGILEKMRKYLKDILDGVDDHNQRETRRTITGVFGSLFGSMASIAPLLGLGGLGLGAGAIGFSLLPETVRDGIVEGFKMLGAEADRAISDAFSGGTLLKMIGAGLLLTPLGMKARTIGGALILISTIHDKLNDWFGTTTDHEEQLRQDRLYPTRNLGERSVSPLLLGFNEYADTHEDVLELNRQLEQAKLDRRKTFEDPTIPPFEKSKIISDMDKGISAIEDRLVEVRDSIIKNMNSNVINIHGLNGALSVAGEIPRQLSPEAVLSAIQVAPVQQSRGWGDRAADTLSNLRNLINGRGDVSSLGLLDFIGKYESKGNYNALTYGRKGYSVPSEANLTDMTIGEVYEYQKGMVDRGHASDTVGKYQFKRQTLSEMVARVPDITEDTKFTKAVQDRLAHELLVVEGYNRWVSGEMPTTEFINEVAGRWAAIPNMSGKSAYDGLAGNKHGVGLMPTIEVFESFKSKFNTNEGILGNLGRMIIPEAGANADVPSGPAFNPTPSTNMREETPNAPISRPSVVVPTVQQPQQPVVTAKPQQNAIPMLSAPAIESAKTVGSMNTEESVTWLKGIKGSIDQLSAKFGELAEGLTDWGGISEDGRLAHDLMGDN